MEEELSKRAKSDEEFPIIAAMLSPDTKSLNFLPDSEKLSAYQLLFTKALSLVDVNENLLVNIKKEKVTDEASTSDLVQLLSLPVLHVDDVECSPAKKLKKVQESKCTDLKEWFDDVTLLSEEKEFPTVVIEREVSMYFRAKNSNKDLDLLQ